MSAVLVEPYAYVLISWKFICSVICSHISMCNGVALLPAHPLLRCVYAQNDTYTRLIWFIRAHVMRIYTTDEIEMNQIQPFHLLPLSR